MKGVVSVFRPDPPIEVIRAAIAEALAKAKTKEARRLLSEVL